MFVLAGRTFFNLWNEMKKLKEVRVRASVGLIVDLFFFIVGGYGAGTAQCSAQKRKQKEQLNSRINEWFGLFFLWGVMGGWSTAQLRSKKKTQANKPLNSFASLKKIGLWVKWWNGTASGGRKLCLLRWRQWNGINEREGPPPKEKRSKWTNEFMNLWICGAAMGRRPTHHSIKSN